MLTFAQTTMIMSIDIDSESKNMLIRIMRGIYDIVSFELQIEEARAYLEDDWVRIQRANHHVSTRKFEMTTYLTL